MYYSLSTEETSDAEAKAKRRLQRDRERERRAHVCALTFPWFQKDLAVVATTDFREKK
jgi:hypothetical protein